MRSGIIWCSGNRSVQSGVLLAADRFDDFADRRRQIIQSIAVCGFELPDLAA